MKHAKWVRRIDIEGKPHDVWQPKRGALVAVAVEPETSNLPVGREPGVPVGVTAAGANQAQTALAQAPRVPTGRAGYRPAHAPGCGPLAALATLAALAWLLG